MQIKICTKLKIELTTSSLSEIFPKFSHILLEILSQFIVAVLLSFVYWKMRNGKKTLLQTPFGKVILPQLQLQCACGHRIVITRQLLHIVPLCRIPPITIRMLGFIGC